MRFGQCAGNGGERRQMPSMRLGPRRAFVDHAEQGRWPKRLWPAARRAKVFSHSQEVGGETLGSTIGDRDLKTIPLEPSANGQTDMRIVIDYQNAAHSNSPHVRVRSTDPRIDRTDFRCREISALFSFPPQSHRFVCPAACIGPAM